MKCYLLTRSRLITLQTTCRPRTGKPVTQSSSHCRTDLHQPCMRRTPSGYRFRLPGPFSSQALCRVTTGKCQTVLITHQDQLSDHSWPHSGSLQKLKFSQTDISTKERALTWARTVFSVFLKAGGTIPRNCVNYAITILHVLQERLLCYRHVYFSTSSEKLVTVVCIRIL